MPSHDLPRLAEEAINDIAPYDVSGQMTLRIYGLPVQKKQARVRQQATVNRAELIVAITGDEAGSLALASSYAKALHGYEITSGRDGSEGPVLKDVNWVDMIADAQGDPLPFGKALDRLYAAKSDAEGGVLVIKNIYDLPANNADRTAVAAAKNGAFQMLHDLLTEYAEKDYTPVIVLTGAADKMDAFFTRNPGVAQYFKTESIPAAAAPLPPPSLPPSVETNAAVTVHRPLKLLKRPSP